MLHFYIRGEDDEEYGPVDLAELREWALDNRVGRETKVRSAEPDSPWRSWGEFPELVAMLAEVEATSVFVRFPKLRVAPFGLRAAAYFVDSLVVGALAFLLVMAAAWVLPAEWGVTVHNFVDGLQRNESSYKVAAVLSVTALQVAYHTYFLGSMGQTIGKGIFGMRVVNDQGDRIDYTQAFYRAFISLGSGFYMIGYTIALFTTHTRTLHDLVAGTYVVRCHDRVRIPAS
ncbi:hypothetical protein DB346_21760 [Verrucomicrobia bacterium LW23]|nr:hypothetical protein DB346_21760 [Verrucomicrobia bacterium LW23]